MKRKDDNTLRWGKILTNVGGATLALILLCGVLFAQFGQRNVSAADGMRESDIAAVAIVNPGINPNATPLRPGIGQAYFDRLIITDRAVIRRFLSASLYSVEIPYRGNEALTGYEQFEVTFLPKPGVRNPGKRWATEKDLSLYGPNWDNQIVVDPYHSPRFRALLREIIAPTPVSVEY